ncbi:MAG: tetratricopeptide repeat protein [Elusimicrobia bacterium]|nr:tetratricopeptide repeat protein [Elusimicrobiota bacterium]
MKKKQFFVLCLILAASFIVCVLALNYDYLGVYNDDAWYINTARSIAGVSAREADFTGKPAGYPVLLAPLARIFPSKESPFRYMSALLMLSSLVLFFIFFRRAGGSPADLLVLTAALGFNPYWIRMGGNVISEIPYLFFMAATLLALTGYGEGKEGMARHIITAVFLAAMFYLKNQGFLMYSAVLLFMMLEKRFRPALYISFFYLILISPVLVSGSAAGRHLEKYAYELRMDYGASSILPLIAGNLADYLRIFYLFVAGGVTGTSAGGHISLAAGLAVSLFVIFSASKEKGDTILPLINIYMLLHVSAHLLWVNTSARYMYPLLPFVIYYLMLFLKRVNRAVLYAVFGILLVKYTYTDTDMIGKSVNGRTSSPSSPSGTFEWIRSHMEPSAVLASQYADRVGLVTGRKTLTLESGRDRMYRSLLESGADYVVSFSGSMLQKSNQYSLQQSMFRRQAYYLEDSSRYAEVYASEREEVRIYRVIGNQAFTEAWEIYEEGAAAYGEGDIGRAGRLFERALAVYPDLTAVSLNLAAIYIVQKDLPEALELLDAAVGRDPGSAVARALRGKLHELTGNGEKARSDWARARRIAEYFGDYRLSKSIARDMSCPGR